MSDDSDPTVPVTARLAQTLSECMNCMVLIAAPRVFARAGSSAELRERLRATLSEFLAAHETTTSKAIADAVVAGRQVLDALDDLPDDATAVPEPMQAQARAFLECFGTKPPDGWDAYDGS